MATTAPTILIFGKNGQVGLALQRSLAPLGHVVALARDDGGLCGDLADPDGLAATVRAVRPGIIVNAAAYTAVDKAEAEPERAFLINAQAPAILAREAQACGAWLVHYSTDYVFDGSGRRPWREDDRPAPSNTYGRSKLAGDEAVAASGGRHLILRSSWIFGARGSNFVTKILQLARDRAELNVIDDQIGAPTSATLIADVTAALLKNALANDRVGGLYHLAAAGETSWYQYARFVIGQALAAGLVLKAAPHSVNPVPSSDYQTPAPRPLNSRLDSARIIQTLGITLPDWRRDVGALIDGLSKDGARSGSPA